MKGPQRDHQREAEMVAMYRSGLTLAGIGEHYGVTRERIRQLLSRHGICGADGGATMRGGIRRARESSVRDARYLSRYGCTHSEYKALTRGIKKAWLEQKRNAIRRGIEFSLTLKEWWGVWAASGKWELRGRGAGRYCMSRIKDGGAYEPGNVYITSVEANGREYQRLAKKLGKRPGYTISKGVYNACPGTKKPFLVRHGRVTVGYFSDPVSAILARERYLASKSSMPPTGSGGTSPA